MSLIKKTNNGFLPFHSILGDFFPGENLMFNRMLDREFLPAVNIIESEKSFDVEFVVPGMKKNDFKIKIDNDVLTVSAEREEEKKEKEKNFTRQEYSYNSFSRSFSLPESAKSDDIKAKYEDGILKMSIAKKAIAVSKGKEIAVQ